MTTTIAEQFGMTEALEILGINAINEGTSTGNNYFSNGDIIESYSPVDGQFVRIALSDSTLRKN